MSSNDPQYHETAWGESERSVYRHAKEIADGSSPEAPALTTTFVELTTHIRERAHHPSIKNMRKSAELTRLLRLMRSRRLFPTPDPRRFTLLWQIATKSTQRPVASEAALTLLVLVSRGLQTADMTRRIDELQGCVELTLPTLALIVELDPEQGPSFLRTKIAKMDLNERRLRLVELLDVLKQDLELEDQELLVRITFEALFQGLSAESRTRLVDRLFREIAEQRSSSGSRWPLVIKPLFEQNLHNLSFQARVLEIIFEDEGAASVYWPLVLHYMRSSDVRLWSERLWAWLNAHGQLGAIEVLYPVSQDTPGLFAPAWRKQATARASALIEVILKREGHKHAIGALSVIKEDGAGQLTLAGHQGALTLDDDPVEPMMLAPYLPRSSPRVAWWVALWMWLRARFSRR